MPGARISRVVIEAIIGGIAAGKGRNAIAREHNVSVGTVTGIAKAEGLTFDRSLTKAATEAKVSDNKLRRASIISGLLDDVEELRAQLRQPHKVFKIGGRDNVYTEQLVDKPPTDAIRNLVVSIGIMLDKHVRLELHDRADTSFNGVDAWFDVMTDGQ